MSPDEYGILRDMLEDHRVAVRDMISGQTRATEELVRRLDDNLATQNRIARQVGNAQAQTGVLNSRVTSIDRSLRAVGDTVDEISDQIPAERIARWDHAAALLADADRVKGWDDASRSLRGVRWMLAQSSKSLAAIGGSFGAGIALVLKLLGAY